MPTDQRVDPHPDFRFQVEIESILTAGFSEIRGLSMGIERTEAAPELADAPLWRHVLERDMSWGDAPTVGSTTRADAPTLKLRRGVTDSTALWNWFRDWIEGAADPADARVVLLDAEGEPTRGWICKQARPVRWDGPTLSATDSGVAMETFELAHDGIELLDVTE
jgi:hypothetical protein